MGAMKDREYGRIVNVSSVSGKRPVPNRAPYTSSKAGMLGLTRTLGAEGGPHGVTANAVCPGSVRGPRIEAVIENHAAGTDRSPEEVRREKVDDTLGASFVESTDVGSLVAYLCSDAASSVTGQAINISEGKVIH
jgi:NAD(P)-dependent dehydrogenase (short-subunit alcohol dehydrogenase family)